MSMMTSASANKLLKKLEEDKLFWMVKERDGRSYVAAADEEPIIPSYDYAEVAGTIDNINTRIVRIKHAININNVTNRIPVGDTTMSVDEILVRMAQLNSRRSILGDMRRRDAKIRISSGSYNARKTTPEYEYINYDLDLVKSAYERINEEITAMQIALDKYNQTFEFEVED